METSICLWGLVGQVGGGWMELNERTGLRVTGGGGGRRVRQDP